MCVFEIHMATMSAHFKKNEWYANIIWNFFLLETALIEFFCCSCFLVITMVPVYARRLCDFCNEKWMKSNDFCAVYWLSSDVRAMEKLLRTICQIQNFCFWKSNRTYLFLTKQQATKQMSPATIYIRFQLVNRNSKIKIAKIVYASLTYLQYNAG